MSKHLSLLPPRSAVHRAVAAPAQVGPLIRGLKSTAKTSIEESAKKTVRKSSSRAAEADSGISWRWYAFGGALTFLLCAFGEGTSPHNSESGPEKPTSTPSSSSPPPPQAPPPARPPPLSATKTTEKKRRKRRPLRNLLLGAVVAFALYSLTGVCHHGPNRVDRAARDGDGGGDDRGGGGGDGDGGDDDSDDGCGKGATIRVASTSHDDETEDGEIEFHSVFDSHDTSQPSSPTTISQRLLQGSASLVYDTSIWTSEDAPTHQEPDATLSSPEPNADVSSEGDETEDGSSIFLRSLSTDDHEDGSVYATPTSSTSSPGHRSPVAGPSTLQFQFPSPSSPLVDSSGSSPLYVRTSSSSPFSPFSELSPGSADSLTSPGVLIENTVLADAQSLNERLRALPEAGPSPESSDGEDVESGSDVGSDGSWEEIVEGCLTIGVLEAAQR